MSRERAKSAIQHILPTETDSRDKMIAKIGAKEVSEAKSHTSGGEVTQHREIAALADKALDAICDRAIPGSQLGKLLEQFGIVAIFPPSHLLGSLWSQTLDCVSAASSWSFALGASIVRASSEALFFCAYPL